jgi:hypothetical protein
MCHRVHWWSFLVVNHFSKFTKSIWLIKWLWITFHSWEKHVRVDGKKNVFHIQSVLCMTFSRWNLFLVLETFKLSLVDATVKFGWQSSVMQDLPMYRTSLQSIPARSLVWLFLTTTATMWCPLEDGGRSWIRIFVAISRQV